jgi:apolipoprotein N-acyltransferase
MATQAKPPTGPLNWKSSLVWLALAVACFHAAYTSLQYPAAGLLIFGYAYGLVKLTDQPNVRRAFYFGLATGFLCYAPQLFFFFRIFSVAAGLLWLVLAFWIGLFTAIACGSIRRWGITRAAWLIPVLWTGVEYFRSELYPLKFSWLNIGYALSAQLIALEKYMTGLGVYGAGFLLFCATLCFPLLRRVKITLFRLLGFIFIVAVVMAIANPTYSGRPRPRIPLVGIQLEFPSPNLLPKILNQALAKNTNAQLFVLSEYTLDGPVPDALKNWCRENGRYLVVGGKAPAGADHYYNTTFVVGTNGDIVFQQAKCTPIQFFKDGLPATNQAVWQSPWGKIGLCICYDLSYTRVTDELIRQGAQLLIVPTMDVEEWGRHEHELHSRVAPVRAAEYGIPIFRLASSGISQAVAGGGFVTAKTSVPGSGEILSAQLRLPRQGSVPLDRVLAPVCTGITAIVFAWLLFGEWQERRSKAAAKTS